MSMKDIEANVDFWIKNKYNVLFKGKHGVGKTATVLEAFNKHNLKWLYFSASTMDPWVDFIGVPKEQKDENGKPYLDLVRPKAFQDDQVEAIFLDEFNRSVKKVRNSVMELIQFKSINGKKFNNLKIIWAAINPDDDENEEYDVEKLDPAQLDRFHVCVDFPYLPSASFFRNKYGKETADVAITWWKELPPEAKNLVSPRRLDYTLDVYKNNGDVRYVLPKQVNVSKLLTELKCGSISKALSSFISNNDAQGAKEFLSVENNYSASIEYIVKQKNNYDFFLPLLAKEKLAGLMHANKNIANYVLDFNKLDKFEDVIQSVAISHKKRPIGKTANYILDQRKIKQAALANNNRYFLKDVDISENKENYFWPINWILSRNNNSWRTYERKSVYGFLADKMPEKFNGVQGSLILEALLSIASRSQINTIKNGMPYLVPMLNHTLDVFENNKYVMTSHTHNVVHCAYMKRKLKQFNYKYA